MRKKRSRGSGSSESRGCCRRCLDGGPAPEGHGRIEERQLGGLGDPVKSGISMTRVKIENGRWLLCFLVFVEA